MKLFQKNSDLTIDISSEAVIRTIAIVLVAILGLQFVGKITHQLELIAISFFLALALNPAVAGLSKHMRIKSRVAATGIAYVVVLGLLVTFMAIVVPPLVKQTADFIKDSPQTIRELKDESSATGRFIQRYNLQPQIDTISSEIGSHVGDVPTTVISTAGRVGGTVISLLTIVVLTFMMLVEGPQWIKRMWALTPQNKRKQRQEIAGKMYKVVTGYINGQVLIAAIAAFFAMTVMLIATRVTHSSVNIMALGGIVFLFGLIPLIGNTLAAIVVIIACLFTSTPLALIMLVYFPVYQQIENATLQPHIQAKSNQLTPLLVFVAALVGAGFGGLLGAFVAIPLAGCLRILFEYKFGDELMPTEDTVAKAKN